MPPNPPNPANNMAKGLASSLQGLDIQPSTPTTVEGRNIDSLPDEVLIKIAQSFQADHKVATLRNLCQVSKRMDSIAREELYHAITASTWRGLRRLWRTVRDKPALGRYIVALELLTPGYYPKNGAAKLDQDDFDLLYSLFLGILKETANLRRLNMVLFGIGRDVQYGGAQMSLYMEFIARLCGLIRQSRQGGSTDVVLPVLEQVRLGADASWKDPSVCEHLGLAQPLLFLPFLALPSMSSLESMDDSGIWPGRPNHAPLNFSLSSTFLSKKGPFQQIKSVILRESKCGLTSIMDICNIFPDMQVFFFQNRQQGDIEDILVAQEIRFNQLHGTHSERRYLTNSLGKLQKLQTLALVPILDSAWSSMWQKYFSGPSGILKLNGLPRLTSLATLISVFASPDGETTGILTPAPMEVLPSSLVSLQIIADHRTCQGLADAEFLNDNWFQPREAAVRFLSALASVCPREFTALRQVEYVWAVDRSSDVVALPDPPRPPQDGDLSFQREKPYGALDPDPQRRCAGTIPLCCDMHTRIQALSPEEDYTSRAEGIVSPFKDRFDALGAAFNEANVSFRVVELKEYSDFYSHWQSGRE